MMRSAWLLTVWAVVAPPALLAADPFQSTVTGAMETLPPGYVPPLVSNGSLSLQVDWLGGQRQQFFRGMKPGLWWAGRRYGPPKDQLVPFGHFRHDLVVDGQKLGPPQRWTQTLDTKQARVSCANEYDAGVTAETTVFVPLTDDLLVVRRRIVARDARPHTVRMTFEYQFTPPGDENVVPRRTTCTSQVNAAAQCADLQFQVDGHRPASGVICVFADQPVEVAVDKQRVTLAAEATLDAAHPLERTFFVLFADSLDGRDFAQRAERLRAEARQTGFAGLWAAHQRHWAAYWDQSFVQLPHEPLQRAYCTAQYHLRANATKWSFPVGIFPTHWAGRFFGWDEMFCYQALVSSNHAAIARRCPEFRLAGLKIALYRNAHYGKPGIFGARYPWEAMEDGNEAAPPGFWMDHVFHMSNIALSAWFQYLYTADHEYLKTTGYPVIKECARFFRANMVYAGADGQMFIGKCTDLERLGPAKLNPFMTACGAIYTLESAAKAAALLGEDPPEAADWTATAAKLRQSLPQEGNRYVPYLGCPDESVASLGGLFPYPVFDASSELQRNAARHYLQHGRAFGNMYQMGTSVCAWYLGWMAAATARLGDRTEPLRLLDEAASGAGCFGEMFEINEEQVSRTPWFSTASGNVVYALNQMLVQCRDEEIRIAPAVPPAWRDYAFKLACHGDLVLGVDVKQGRLTQLVFEPGRDSVTYRRTLLIPAELLAEGALKQPSVKSVRSAGGMQQVVIQFQGRTVLLGNDQR